MIEAATDDLSNSDADVDIVRDATMTFRIRGCQDCLNNAMDDVFGKTPIGNAKIRASDTPAPPPNPTFGEMQELLVSCFSLGAVKIGANPPNLICRWLEHRAGRCKRTTLRCPCANRFDPEILLTNCFVFTTTDTGGIDKFAGSARKYRNIGEFPISAGSYG